MFSDVFVNVTILLSFIFIVGQLFRDRTLHNPLSLQGKVLLGIISGVLGIILMKYSIRVESMVFDLRHLAIIIAAVSGGPIASILAAFIISITRVMMIPTTSYISILAFVSAMLVGVGCGVIVKMISSWKLRWIWLHLYCIFILCTTLLLVTRNISIYILYFTAFIATGYVAYVSITYVNQSNKLYKNMKNQATIDYLTGLQNVRQFDIYLNRYIERNENKNEPLSLLMFDIDHFKKVNDTYGHQAGDAVLQQLASILKEHAISNLAFRTGGEEFSLILPNFTLVKAMDKGEEIRSAVQKHGFSISGEMAIFVTVSVGASMYHGSSDEFIRKADEALYCSKHLGRNRVSIM